LRESIGRPRSTKRHGDRGAPRHMARKPFGVLASSALDVRGTVPGQKLGAAWQRQRDFRCGQSDFSADGALRVRRGWE